MSDFSVISGHFTERSSTLLDASLGKEMAGFMKRQEELLDYIVKSDQQLALGEWKVPDKAPLRSILPSLLKYGDLQLIDSLGRPVEGGTFPLLLPTDVNGVLFDLKDDERRIPGLLQNLLLRLLLSMRMNSMKVSIVDMDFGASFRLAASIKNTHLKSEVLFKQEDITRLVEGLAQEVGETNRNLQGRYRNLEEYNADAGELAIPYHIVFIDDFPNGFNPMLLDGLLRLLENGNASRAGVKIFINYGTRNPAPHGFDLTAFERRCSVIRKEGKTVFSNWPFRFPDNLEASFETESPADVSSLVDFLNGIRLQGPIVSLDSWLQGLIDKDQVWKGSTIEGIKVPVGFISPRETFDFYVANDLDSNCKDYFALIAGQPSAGKTTFLYNIIVNAAMMYAPDELSMYLADFAEGASFSVFRDLPHARALMLSNNREYALRMLEDVSKQCKERSHLYQKASRQFGKMITKLSAYREVTGEKLPRILIVIDEFHSLFLSTDATTIRAKEMLCEGIRNWRKFGVSIILSTQSITGVNFGNADTQITYRFAMTLPEPDSKAVLRNSEAMRLPKVGEVIMNNTADGRVDMNVHFRSAYSRKYIDYVQYMSRLYKERYPDDKHVPFICAADQYADIADNPVLVESIVDNKAVVDHLSCNVFVGKPDLLRPGHTRVRYRRQLRSNTLILGEDYRTAIFNVLLQVIQIRCQSHPDSLFYIVNGFSPGDFYYEKLNSLGTFSDNVRIEPSGHIPQILETLSAESKRRTEALRDGRMTEPRIVLAILNTQNCYDLKPVPDRYSRMDQSPCAKQLATLLTIGAPLGMHVILHGLSYETLFKTGGIISFNDLQAFENLFFLMGADIENLMLSRIRVSAPERENGMIVINAKVDGEEYEQCEAYTDITVDRNNATVDYLTKLFTLFRHA